MKQFKAVVWLPEDTEFCAEYERGCMFLLGNATCVLLGETLRTRDDIPVKDRQCPSLVLGKEEE